MAPLNFHVRHEVAPERVWGVLDAIVKGLEYEHITQSERQLSRLRQLELVTSKGDIKPTEVGLEIHRIGERRLELVWELFHFLHYERWCAADSSENTMFFTYYDYCNLLYSKRKVELTVQREALAAEMTHRISSSPYFVSELSQLAKGAVSLSTNSLVGVEHWLQKLSPEVIVDDQFELRHYCAPELLLMALGYITKTTEAQLGVELLLTDERRSILCQICLIEDSVLNQMLQWLYPEYPEFVQPGTQTGSYGQFVRVLKLPSLKDLLP